MSADHGAPGKSPIREIEILREAVLRLCELQQELAHKVEAALNRTNGADPTSVSSETPIEAL